MSLKKSIQGEKSLQKSINETIHDFSDCALCNLCCIDGVLYLEEQDLQKISKYLKIKPKHLVEHYTNYNLSTGEIKIIMPCSFLKNNKCIIYPVRPRVCQNYPIFVQNENVYVYGVESCSKSTIFLDAFIDFLDKYHPDCSKQIKRKIDKDRPLKKDESINIMFSKYHVELFIKWMKKSKKIVNKTKTSN